MCQLADLLVEGGGTLGQVAHFVGNHGEAATGFTGTRCFDGGVQGQQVGLVGDRLDIFQQREDAIQMLSHLVDVMDGIGALAAHLFQRFHQLLHAGAGMLGEAGDVDAGAAIVAGAVDDAGQCLALLTRFAIHRFEAATQAGHGLADQFAGTLDFRARSVDFVADERTQFVEQLVLLAQDAGLVGLGRNWEYVTQAAKPNQLRVMVARIAQRTEAGQSNPTAKGNSKVRAKGAARRMSGREYMGVLGRVTVAVSALPPLSLATIATSPGPFDRRWRASAAASAQM